MRLVESDSAAQGKYLIIIKIAIAKNTMNQYATVA